MKSRFFNQIAKLVMNDFGDFVRDSHQYLIDIASQRFTDQVKVLKIDAR